MEGINTSGHTGLYIIRNGSLTGKRYRDENPELFSLRYAKPRACPSGPEPTLLMLRKMTGSSADDAIAAPITTGGLLKWDSLRIQVSMELHFWAPDCVGSCGFLVQSSSSSVARDSVSRFSIVQTLLLREATRGAAVLLLRYRNQMFFSGADESAEHRWLHARPDHI